MSELKKIRFLISRGSPTTGLIIRAGSVLDFPLFWADRFIADGTAVAVESDHSSGEPTAKPKKKKGENNG